jgi:hypothetical protein
MQVAIYNENCTRAGREVSDREAEAYDDLREFGDCTVFEGTPGELLALADLREQHARPGGGGVFDRRVAESIRRAVYERHPEMEPAPDE